MGTLQEHLTEIEKSAHNVDAVSAARKRLVDELESDPDASDAVTEALYRLGLTTLLVRKDLNAAMELFKRAAERKNAAWSPLARTSYAMTLQAKNKHQQAVFELRKVIGTGEPTAQSVTALCMLCTILRDARAKPTDIDKADKERIQALTALVSKVPDKTEEAAHWRLLLAHAHKEGGSRSECKKQLEAVVAMGNAAGKDALAQAREVLKGM